MGWFILSNPESYKKIVERGGGPVARFVSFKNRGVTSSGYEWIHLKISTKKDAMTLRDNCKQEYYLAKAWGECAIQCKNRLKKGCKFQFAGQIKKGKIQTPDGEVYPGEIHLIELLNVEYTDENKEYADDG